MGQLKIVPGGLQLSGQALFLDVLRASSIRSKHGQPITIGTQSDTVIEIVLLVFFTCTFECTIFIFVINPFLNRIIEKFLN